MALDTPDPSGVAGSLGTRVAVDVLAALGASERPTVAGVLGVAEELFNSRPNGIDTDDPCRERRVKRSAEKPGCYRLATRLLPRPRAG